MHSTFDFFQHEDLHHILIPTSYCLEPSELGAPREIIPIAVCGHLQLKSEGSLEPLNAAALPVGGLRQDHHGTEQMPVTPGSALPYHAALTPFAPSINTTGGGVISLLVAPDNSSIVCALCLMSSQPLFPAACELLHPNAVQGGTTSPKFCLAYTLTLYWVLCKPNSCFFNSMGPERDAYLLK